jgi:hypothetical protein
MGICIYFGGLRFSRLSDHLNCDWRAGWPFATPVHNRSRGKHFDLLISDHLTRLAPVASMTGARNFRLSGFVTSCAAISRLVPEFLYREDLFFEVKKRDNPRLPDSVVSLRADGPNAYARQGNVTQPGRSGNSSIYQI